MRPPQPIAICECGVPFVAVRPAERDQGCDECRVLFGYGQRKTARIPAEAATVRWTIGKCTICGETCRGAYCETHRLEARRRSWKFSKRRAYVRKKAA